MRIENEFSEMARWEERDGEMDFFTKREREKEKKEIKWRMENEFSEMARWRDGFFLQREKEKKRKREKEVNPNNAVKTDGSILSTAL